MTMQQKNSSPTLPFHALQREEEELYCFDQELKLNCRINQKKLLFNFSDPNFNAIL